MKTSEVILKTQELWGIPADKRVPHVGPLTRDLFAKLSMLSPESEWGALVVEPPVTDGEIHTVKASTFADPADVAEFRKCKATGKTDEECFKVGDNGIGFTGLDCTDPSIPYIALPKDHWIVRWENKASAVGKIVVVEFNGRRVDCILGDTMPALADITNGCGIDLAPGAQKAFGIGPGTYEGVTWRWSAAQPTIPAPPTPLPAPATDPIHNDWPKEADAAAFFGYPPNLTQIEVAYPMRMFYGGMWHPIEKITCNIKVAASLRRIFAAILAAFGNDLAAIKAANADVYDGCLNDRNISGSSHRSMHAYAAAIDLDAEHNGFNTGHGKIDPRVVSIFKEEGWRWGGDYHDRTDPMHFEACV